MQSLISWQGGKGKMRKKLVSMFPNKEIKCYCETMVGAAWVILTLPAWYAKTEYINDINKDLITFWRVIRDQKDEFIESFKYVPKSRTIFYEYRERFVSGDYNNDLQRAHIFFYLCKLGFGSRMKSPTFGTSKERASSLNYATLPKLVDRVWGRLKDVMIENKDYVQLILDQDAPATHFFIDPPYHETAGYVGSDWNEKEYITLAETCRNIQGTFLLTINDTPLIRDLFKDFNIHSHQFQFCISKTDNDQIIDELIITNYTVPDHSITNTSIERRLKSSKQQTKPLF